MGERREETGKRRRDGTADTQQAGQHNKKHGTKEGTLKRLRVGCVMEDLWGDNTKEEEETIENNMRMEPGRVVETGVVAQRTGKKEKTAKRERMSGGGDQPKGGGQTKSK